MSWTRNHRMTILAIAAATTPLFGCSGGDTQADDETSHSLSDAIRNNGASDASCHRDAGGDAKGINGALPCLDAKGKDTVVAAFHPYGSTNTGVTPSFHLLSQNGNIVFGATSNETDYSYFTVSRCGGVVTTLHKSTKHASSDYDRGEFAVDAKNVYYGDVSPGGAAHLMKTPLSGGPAVSLATSPSHIEGVASSGNHVFWTAHGPAVSKVDLATGTVTPAWTIAADNGAHDYAFDIVADGSQLFFAGLAVMMSVPLSGGNAYVFGSVPSSFAINSTDLFEGVIGSEGQSSLVRVSKGGASPKTIVPDFGSYQLAADDSNVYWSDWGAGIVRRVPVQGGAIMDFAVHASTKTVLSTAIGLDETYVYWVSQDDSGLIEVHRESK